MSNSRITDREKWLRKYLDYVRHEFRLTFVVIIPKVACIKDDLGALLESLAGGDMNKDLYFERSYTFYSIQDFYHYVDFYLEMPLTRREICRAINAGINLAKNHRIQACNYPKYNIMTLLGENELLMNGLEDLNCLKDLGKHSSCSTNVYKVLWKYPSHRDNITHKFEPISGKYAEIKSKQYPPNDFSEKNIHMTFSYRVANMYYDGPIRNPDGYGEFLRKIWFARGDYASIYNYVKNFFFNDITSSEMRQISGHFGEKEDKLKLPGKNNLVNKFFNYSMKMCKVERLVQIGDIYCVQN